MRGCILSVLLLLACSAAQGAIDTSSGFGESGNSPTVRWSQGFGGEVTAPVPPLSETWRDARPESGASYNVIQGGSLIGSDLAGSGYTRVNPVSMTGVGNNSSAPIAPVSMVVASEDSPWKRIAGLISDFLFEISVVVVVLIGAGWLYMRESSAGAARAS